jgi:hypothetical protein
MVILDDVSWRVERGQHWVGQWRERFGKIIAERAIGYLMPTAGEVNCSASAMVKATGGTPQTRRAREFLVASDDGR